MCWWSSNHPMWDIYLIGKEKHQFLVGEFLQKNGAWIHALELNGLRKLGREPHGAAPGGEVEHAC